MLFHRKGDEVRMVPETPATVAALPAALCTPLARKYIRETLQNGGVIVTLRRGDEYLSLAVFTERVQQHLWLSHIETVPEHRHKGYAGELLRRVLERPELHRPLTAHCNAGFESYPYLRALLERAGFAETGGYHTYIVEKQAFLENGGEQRLAFVHRGLTRAQEEGFTLLRLDEADAALLAQLRDSRGSAFANTLNPEGILCVPDYILPDHSYLLLRDGVIAAYCLVSARSAQMAEIDQVAVAADYRRAGMAMLPVLVAYDQMLREGRFNALMWQIMDGNTECTEMVRQLVRCPMTVMTLREMRRPADA